MAEQLILVRHATVGPLWRGRYVGALDPSLCEDGARQAEALAKALQSRDIHKIFYSPLKRTQETAEVIARTINANIEKDTELREVSFGRWEGKTFSEIQAQDPELVTQWANWDPQFGFPEGELIGHFLNRVERVADRLANVDAKNILVITHGGVVRSMLCYLLGLDPRKYVAFEVQQAAISVVRLYDGKGVLTELNERCHL